MKNDVPKYNVGDIVCADWSHTTPFEEAKILKVFYAENVDDTMDNGYIYVVCAIGNDGKEMRSYKKMIGQGGLTLLKQKT